MLTYFHSHHKCASRWAIRYLCDVAERNYLCFDTSDVTKAVGSRHGDLAFFGNSTYQRADADDLRGVHFVRNPLNIIVSAYFSHLNTHPDTGWPELTRQRRLLRDVDLEDGLFLTVSFLERAEIKAGTVGPLHALRAWNYDDARFATMRIEDFTRAPSAMIRAMVPLSRLNLSPDWCFAFEAFSGGRAPGERDEASHYRSGDPEEWKSYLPRHIVDYVRGAYAPLLAHAYPDMLAGSGTGARPTGSGSRADPSLRPAQAVNGAEGGSAIGGHAAARA